MLRASLNNIDGCIIDMDGVLWRGQQPLPGLTALFAQLAQRDLPFVLATNNSSKTPQQYAAKLAAMGVRVDAQRILTSSLVAADYLRGMVPAGAAVYVVGEEGLREALRAAGFTIETDIDPNACAGRVHAVVAGIDFHLTYDTLKRAALHIQHGACFIGTNGDLTFPAEEGLIPGAGAILAAISAATGVKPVTMGKPEPPMFAAALKQLGTVPQRTLMVGDRLDTDIAGAQRMGLRTLLVTSGVDDEEAIVRTNIHPDAVLPSIAELARLL